VCVRRSCVGTVVYNSAQSFLHGRLVVPSSTDLRIASLGTALPPVPGEVLVFLSGPILKIHDAGVSVADWYP
jgi:hypothetical protein